MKNKILICVIVFVLAMISSSCSNKWESHNIDPGTSLKEDPKDGSKEDSKDDVKEDPEDTEKYFAEKYSIYRNPIDQYFWSKIYSWDASQTEIRKAQKAYKKAWKTEYRNMMKWMKKKCVYDEDKKNIRLLEKKIAAQSEGELYRDVCMRILNLHGGEGGYQFKFRESD